MDEDDIFNDEDVSDSALYAPLITPKVLTVPWEEEILEVESEDVPHEQPRAQFDEPFDLIEKIEINVSYFDKPEGGGGCGDGSPESPKPCDENLDLDDFIQFMTEDIGDEEPGGTDSIGSNLFEVESEKSERIKIVKKDRNFLNT